MQQFFKYNDVKIYHTNSHLKSVIIERFSRSLRELMMKEFVKNNNTIWYNILPKLIKIYNNRYHSTIKMKPIQVNKNNEKYTRENIYTYDKTTKIPRFKIYDLVRISLKRRPIFDKPSSNIKWSEELFKIYLINRSNVITYKMKDLNDEIIEGIFYERELQKTKNTSQVYIIEKVIRKIYKKHNMKYEPRNDTKFIRVRYLLKKSKDNDDIDTSLYNHFHTSLSESNKLYHKIPTYQEDEQTGSSINNIIINDKDLNNGILRVRYLNNRKLTNNLLKHDYKISRNMINAIKYNKNIHKLSKNEMKIYHELQKFLNKEQDIHVLIGSYLSGNNSKKLYKKISSMLYNKLKNNIIPKREYTKLINKINKI